MGTALFGAYFLRNPLLFDHYDELLHEATLWRLADHQRLITGNSLLPMSPSFPGLELFTVGVHWITYLPWVVCQVIVVVVSRVLLLAALFRLFDRLTGSPRAGGIGALLYMASPQFFFFNAQFSYQTLGLALGVLTVLLVVEAGIPRARLEVGRRRWPSDASPR